jgi:hypothetical protein
MSMMGELTFFLGIQVKQTKQDTFVHQAKYMKDLMKKFNMAELKPVSTLMSSAASLGPDEDGEAVHVLSGFPTLFASDSSSASFQVSQTHS